MSHHSYTGPPKVFRRIRRRAFTPVNVATSMYRFLSLEEGQQAHMPHRPWLEKGWMLPCLKLINFLGPLPFPRV
jgi:hypothetical protein